MHEILFRGQRVDTGEWVFGMLCQYHAGVSAKIAANDFGTYEQGMAYCVNPATVGQYTGLTDRNGVKIFEGDILHFINTYRNVNHEWHCTVEFVDGAFVCRYIESEGHLGEYNYFTSWNVPLVQWDVIGNIHDNPELLQEISR